MKLWQKDNSKATLKNIENFTVGKDRELDLYLAKFDLLGSMAHATMLERIGLLKNDELLALKKSCIAIYNDLILTGKFEILDGIEDVHSQIEFLLTQALGDIGKKIHSGRSRNDQVLVDMKMYLRHEIEEIINVTKRLFDILLLKSNLHKDDLLPGYTHLQIAMPSSFGLWFGAYAESLIDDLTILQSVFKIVNKNPLGSGAGYGSSFPLDRTLTTALLGFDDLNYNVVYAQMTRGKMEYALATGISFLANTIGRLAMDTCLYNSQNFAFIKLPEEMTTGSSIMPHKKNPDVAEILRGKCNLLKALPTQISMLLSNLPSGYHRELQLLKESIIPAILEIKNCIEMASFMVEHMQVEKDLLKSSKYDLLFSVENVNQKVIEGMPFRDAYKQIGEEINDGNFKPNRELNHTLEGSIGNLCNDSLNENMDKVIAGFTFSEINDALEQLLKA